MQMTRTLWRLTRPLLTTAAVWLALVVPIWAQAEEEGESLGAEGAGPWVLPYILVILGVALGLILVLRPSKRRDKPQSAMFEEQGDDEDDGK